MNLVIYNSEAKETRREFTLWKSEFMILYKDFSFYIRKSNEFSVNLH